MTSRELPMAMHNDGPEGVVDCECRRHDIDRWDWFAGQALAGICAHVDTWGLNCGQIAEVARHIADIMVERGD